MAITLYEQQELFDKTLGPLGPDTLTLSVLVSLSAQNTAITFSTEYKLFSDIPLAEAYLNKILRVCLDVSKTEKKSFAINSLESIIVSLIANSSFTYAQISAASDAAWADFVNDNMIQAFEILAGVRQEEKSAYYAIAK